MLILATDTSLPLLSVALLRDGRLLGSITLEGQSSRNEKLLPAVDWILAESGVDRLAVDLFAVTRGPGSFTGVRIGLATMQGIAMVLGKPLCTMSSHEAIALGDIAVPGRVLVVDDAGRGEFYVSLFEGGSEAGVPQLASAAEVEALSRNVDRLVTVSQFIQHGNTAAACARRAQTIQERGLLESHREIAPIYVRLAEAEMQLRQRQNA